MVSSMNNIQTFHKKFLSSYFYIVFDESDNFSKSKDKDLEYYSLLADKFYPCFLEFIGFLENAENPTEEKIQYESFEIAKKHFPKNEVGMFFSCIYALLFKQKSGPKFSSMIKMIGEDKVLEALKNKVFEMKFA